MQLDAALVQHVLEDAGRLARDVLEDERTHTPTLAAADGRDYTMVIGVPSGMSRASLRMSAFRMRMQP